MKKMFLSNPFFYLLGHLKKKRKAQFGIIVIFALFTALLESYSLAVMYSLLSFFDKTLKDGSNDNTMGIAGNYLFDVDSLETMTWLYAIVIASCTILRVLLANWQLKFSSSISKDLSDLALNGILKKSYQWHINSNSATIVGILNSDIPIVATSVYSALTLASNILMLAAIITTLMLISPTLLLLVSTLFVFYIITYRLSANRLATYGHLLSSSYTRKLKTLQIAIGGIRDIKINKTEKYFTSLYLKDNQSYYDSSASINFAAQVPRFAIELIVIYLIIAYITYMTHGNNQISNVFPSVGILFVALYRILQPIQQAYASFSAIKAANTSIKSINTFYADIACKPTASPIAPCPNEFDNSTIPTFKSIEFKDVSFAYQGSTNQSLANINLTIKSGLKIGIVGPSGSGKSTFANLLLGLLSPTKGTILVDQMDIHSSSKLLYKWQDQIAHVPQSVYVSDETILSNIAFGLSESDICIDRATACAKQAGILEYILSTEYGFFTLLGERGSQMSGGQAQRIGIARALYSNPHILVADECTSALDTTLESKIIRSLIEKDKDKTVLFICHRIRALKNFDLILCFNGGQLVGVGDYHQLLTSCTIFRSLEAST